MKNLTIVSDVITANAITHGGVLIRYNKLRKLKTA